MSENYSEYLAWFERQSRLVDEEKSRMEYPLTVEKWNRQKREKGGGK